jgi:hypothetical protein
MDYKGEHDHDNDDAEKYTFDDHGPIVAHKLPSRAVLGVRVHSRARHAPEFVLVQIVL